MMKTISIIVSSALHIAVLSFIGTDYVIHSQYAKPTQKSTVYLLKEGLYSPVEKNTKPKNTGRKIIKKTKKIHAEKTINKPKKRISSRKKKTITNMASGGLCGKNKQTKCKTNKTDYINKIREIIQKNTFYPIFAKRMKLQGKVILTITIEKNGQIKSIKIKKPCKYSILNKTALKIVKKSEPFPPAKEKTKISIPFIFKLNKI